MDRKKNIELINKVVKSTNGIYFTDWTFDMMLHKVSGKEYPFDTELMKVLPKLYVSDGVYVDAVPDEGVIMFATDFDDSLMPIPFDAVSDELLDRIGRQVMMVLKDNKAA